MKIVGIMMLNLITCYGMAHTIPVIFIHAGDSFYLSDTLHQAKLFNDRVILLGDALNNHYKGIEHYNYTDYNDEANNFAERYYHASNNSYEFELFCFQRWYILKRFMDQHSLSRCFYSDSDGMLYCNVTQAFLPYSMFDACYSLPDCNCIGSAHFSYWNSQAITAFCEFMNRIYEKKARTNEKFHDIIDNFQQGQWWTNISDMTLLLKFIQSNPESKIGKLNAVINDSTFDHNIGLHEDHYEIIEDISTKHPMKKIVWLNNMPYGVNRESGKLIRFNALHFQGVYKDYISQFRKVEE